MGLLNKFRKQENKKSLEKEIIDNLRSLLNTKESFGAFQEGLGMKTYSSSKSSNDTITEIINNIKYNIEKFEKRIQVIEIEPINDKEFFNLTLCIRCILGGSFHSFYLGFKPFKNSIEVEAEEYEQD